MKNLKDSVEFEGNKITINYSNYGSDNKYYGDLFDWLSQFDIITASEIKEDCVIFSGKLLDFTHFDEMILAKKESVTLFIKEDLKNYKDKNRDFYNWYYNK